MLHFNPLKFKLRLRLFQCKIFSSVWLHFKKCFEKYFLVFGCVLENTIENTFSTCCSHFLTFSQLPNKYIISFLNTETQKKQNSGKKFIKSGQYRNTKETKPRKKNSSNPIKLREEGRERGDWVRSRGEIARRRRLGSI